MERLIQEDYLHDPWKMMVSCILLNQTSNKQVRPILETLFDLIPSPEEASKTNPNSIAKIIKPTGLYNIKSNRIILMSKKWISGFKDASELPGIGKYGSDSWKIFIEGERNVNVTDKKLKLYLSSIERSKDI